MEALPSSVCLPTEGTVVCGTDFVLHFHDHLFRSESNAKSNETGCKLIMNGDRYGWKGGGDREYFEIILPEVEWKEKETLWRYQDCSFLECDTV